MEANVVDHSSMWSLVSNASIVVQLVMLILVAASVTSWIMIFQRSNLLRAGRRALESFEERFWSGIDLSKLYRQAGSNPDPDSGVEQIFRAGFKEFSRLRQQPGVDPEAVFPVQCAWQFPVKRKNSSRACRFLQPSVPSAHTSVCSVPCGGS